MNALLIMALSTLAAREPLKVPGWTPPAPVEKKAEPLEAPAPKPDEGVVFLAPLAEKSPAERRVGLSTGVGVLALSPSLELEIAPMNHLSLYAGGEFSALRLGYAGQVGFRLRPMEGLIGPFLDLHVRFSRFQSLLNLLPEVSETGSPGAMFGFTLVSQQGFTFSAGVGASFLAKTTDTRYQLTTRDTAFVPLPQVDSASTTKIGPVPELRLNVGVAL
ncbi:MAG: hypothetical protein ABTQ32_40060 [Myxococcaceae bacterium]